MIDIGQKLHDRMIKQGLEPDEIVFNNLLTGCIPGSNAVLGRSIFKDMQVRGVAPSIVTLSILVKLLSKCHEWDEVKELLDTAPVKLGLPHESRLYTQLAQACIRERR